MHVELTAAVWSYSSEFDRQGVLRLLVVFDGVVVAAATVPELASTQDGAVGEVEPQVLCHLTLLTLPATRGDLLARPVKLDQCVGVSEQTDAFRIRHSQNSCEHNILYDLNNYVSFYAT